jgi:hypothetical protein
MFAAVLLMIGGVLNIVYGIAAIGNSSFFVHNTHYVFASLKGWGWITLILGILEGSRPVAVWRRPIRAVVRNRRWRPGRARRAVVDPGLPAMVDRDLRPQPVDRLRAGDLRRA